MKDTETSLLSVKSAMALKPMLYNLKVRHPHCVVKLTMCSIYVYVKTQLYLLVVY